MCLCLTSVHDTWCHDLAQPHITQFIVGTMETWPAYIQPSSFQGTVLNLKQISATCFSPITHARTHARTHTHTNELSCLKYLFPQISSYLFQQDFTWVPTLCQSQKYQLGKEVGDWQSKSVHFISPKYYRPEVYNAWNQLLPYYQFL